MVIYKGTLEPRCSDQKEGYIIRNLKITAYNVQGHLPRAGPTCRTGGDPADTMDGPDGGQGSPHPPLRGEGGYSQLPVIFYFILYEI